MRRRSLLVLVFAVGACDAVSSSNNTRLPDGGAGTTAATGGRGGSGGGAGGSSATGGSTSTAGTTSTGGVTGTGGVGETGGVTGTGGVSVTGGASGTAGATGVGGMKATGGATGTGGARATGGAGATGGGIGMGGAGGTAAPDAAGTSNDASMDSGGDGKLDLPSSAGRDGKQDVRGPVQLGADSDGGTCPYTGHVSYSITNRSANPTAAEQTAYDRITAAMEQAVAYYNCYTNITMDERVQYDPSVATADGNSNGSIRFGSEVSYMVLPTAMHEISHTVGIGTASKWASMMVTPAGGGTRTWSGATATAEMRAIKGDPTALVYGDNQHFWDYGLNYASEYVTEFDLLAHCRMVVALRKDMGM